MCKKAPDPLLGDIDSKRKKASTQLQKKAWLQEIHNFRINQPLLISGSSFCSIMGKALSYHTSNLGLIPLEVISIT